MGWRDELAAELKRRAGRPYAACDCLGLVDEVLCSLRRIEPGPILRSFDTGWIVREMLLRHPSDGCSTRSLEPGDVAMARLPDSQGHLMIVGDDPRTVWHADRVAGVCPEPLVRWAPKLRAAWRPRDKEKWRAS